MLKGNEKTRAAQKKAAQEWVRNKFGKVCTQDEADAILKEYSQRAAIVFENVDRRLRQ